MSGAINMSRSLQVKDVYDYAYEIAQEFDKIVDTVDIEQATVLINKVINVLELLEDHVKQVEQLEQENVDLRAKYIQWTCDKFSSEQEKSSLKQAFEELEESWSQESITLRSLIEKLKKENNLLMQSISSAKKENPKETDDCINTVISDQTNLIAKLQLHLKQKDTQLENNHTTIELLNSKIEDLLKLNKSLHLRYQEVKDLLKVSYSEKYEYKYKQDLQAQKISDLETKYEALKKSLAEKNEGTTKLVYPSRGENVDDSNIDVKCLIEERNDLRQTISKLQNKLALAKHQCEEYKGNFNKVSGKPNQSSSQENGRIQQIFRLFLGVIHINI